MKALTSPSTWDSAPAKASKATRRPVPVSPWYGRPISGLDRPLIQRKQCACGGGCPTCQEQKSAETIQTKLAISTPGDQFEREADHVADQIMRMPDPVLQRQCNTCADKSNPSPSETGETQIQRRANSGGGAREAASNFTSRLGAGVPLDTASRRYFEPRFGRDFDNVRIHDGPSAAAAAASVQARAFTLGRDVVFAAGEYDPGSEGGKRLLAHELTHVVQQSGSGGIIQRLPDENAEAQAPADVNTSGDEGHNREDEIEWMSQVPRAPASDAGSAQNLDEPAGAPPTSPATTTPTGEITLETGNTGAGPINNLVHQQVCVTPGGDSKYCFSFAAVGAQLPQFSSTWLGWSSLVVSAILKGEVYDPAPVPGATIVNRHTPTIAQAVNWLRYMRRTRLGLQDGYSVARHNCRLFSQWEFRDAPSHW